MQRRRLLRGLAAAGLGSTAGCGRLGPSVQGQRIRGWEFETDRPRDGRAPDAEPAVAFDEDHDRVVVSGHVYYGSSSCDEPRLDRVTDDPDADRLRIEVGYGSDWPPSPGCTADVAGTFYRLSVRFDGTLPATVTVLEDESGFEDQRRTVEG